MRVGRVGAMMLNRAEELRLAALAKVRANEIEEAFSLYDEALTLTDDPEAQELISINKADALIMMERTGPEVSELPRIIMRRRNLRHVYLAAYALQYKHRLENDMKRAVFYGELAVRTAEEAGEPVWRRVVLHQLGDMYLSDSKIERASECYEMALSIIDESAANNDRVLAHGLALDGLVYCKILSGYVRDGIDLLHESLTILRDAMSRAEVFVDLCYGYLELSDFDRAQFYGEAALEIATDDRQIRNADYLLGEVANTLGDTSKAEYHFEELARFYPEFK